MLLIGPFLIRADCVYPNVNLYGINVSHVNPSDHPGYVSLVAITLTTTTKKYGVKKPGVEKFRVEMSCNL